MARELMLTVGMRFRAGLKRAQMSVIGLQLDIAKKDYIKRTFVMTNVATPLPKDGIQVPTYCFMLNLDETNPVIVGSSDADIGLIRISPGKIALFEIFSPTPHVRAAEGTARIEYLMVDQ